VTIFPSFLQGNEFEKIEEEIQERDHAINEVEIEEKRAKIFFDLALTSYQDQEVERAFFYFLEALKRVSKEAPIDMKDEEQSIYHQALQIYLSSAGREPSEVATALLLEYGGIADRNPHFLHLNFLIAIAYANKGEYDHFFTRFYEGFPYLSETFLALKTQGIICLRFSRLTRFQEERAHFQKEAFTYLTQALDKNPHDPSLYKTLISLAKEENTSLCTHYLRKIVENRVILPRCEIYMYVKEAVLLGEFEIGQEIIDQAKAHYTYSRAIAEAQHYLDQEAVINLSGSKL
jgi:tetratricopeptide (TPR) repeat protein